MDSNKEKPSGIHIFSKHLEFPVMIEEHSDWDRTQIGYLRTDIHTTESLIRWCKAHGMDCRVIYPLRRWEIVRNPLRYMRYVLSMQRRIRRN